MVKENKNASQFSDFLERSGQIIILSILWLICSIPIISLGPSTAALYYAVVKSVRCQRGSFLHEFLSSFKANLLPGLPVTALLLLYLLLSSGSIYFAYSSPSLPQGLRFLFFSVGGVFFILILLISSCVYILLSRLQLSLVECFKVSILFSVLNYKCTAKLILLLLCTLFIMILFPASLLFLPGLSCYLSSFVFEPTFKTYLAQFPEQDSSIDSWYSEI